MKFSPRGFGGLRPDPEFIKRDGWRSMDTLVVSIKDERLTWPERESLEQIGDKLYGKRKPDGGRHK